MRPGPVPTHHVLERSWIKLLSDVLSEGRYRHPVKLGTVDDRRARGPLNAENLA